MTESPIHFDGKNPLDHIIEARQKGKIATSEIHGEELPGHYSATADSAKDTAFLLVILSTLLYELSFPPEQLHWFLVVFLFGLMLWKTGRSAILGWRRLERLHRLIEEERWEIEHHRSQEREELKALYATKGFSGKLLDEVIDVLMADDNRLLQEMLEEELGVNLESYEHPLKQASGAFLGCIGTSIILSFGFFYLPVWGIYVCAALVISLAAGTTAQLEKNQLLPAIVWNLAAAALGVGSAYFLGQQIFR